MIQEVVCFDLDDTLYKEIDFLKSGYRKVAEMVEKRFRVDACEAYDRLLMWYRQKENPFVRLNETYGLDNPISDYLNVYRYHEPDIMLSNGVSDTLYELRNRGIVLGLITDGRSISQRNKIKALGLERWFADENIIISEEFGSDKLKERNFCYFMDKYPQGRFYYVGDNPLKDFVVANRLSWMTLMLKDDGRNIHRQGDVPMGYQPKRTISGIKELLKIIAAQ